MKNKTSIKTSVAILIGTAFIILNVFLFRWLELNIVPEKYMDAYWASVGIYVVGVGTAISSYFIFMDE